MSSDDVGSFDQLPLDPRLLKAVADLGFEAPTPIQAAAIPLLLEGRDVIGGARTGSGKTAAFGLPLLHRLRDGAKGVRALLLAPTRELALQVRDALADLGKELGLGIVAIYGGSAYGPQIGALRDGAQIVVGTPGRVLDLMGGGHLDLSGVETLVLDEADEMLRMGFIDDVEAILGATPSSRQIALFSATMPDRIRDIAERYLKDPTAVQVEEESHTTEHIEQRWIRVPMEHKVDALVRVLASEPRGTTLVFVRTRQNAIEVSDELAARGVAVDALHGEMNQGARERVLRRLRSNSLDLVVATDVAARGLDVDHVTHVVNLDLPVDLDTYVHRIGRTGRAGRAGIAITFVTPKQVHAIRHIAHQIGADIKHVPVPSGADIANAGRRRLAEAMLAPYDGDDAPARAFLDEVVASSGRSIEDLAAVAVRMLASLREVTLAVPDAADEPVWARPMPVAKERDLQRANEVELFFPVGAFVRVRAGDLVGALCNEAGVANFEIGKVTVLDRKSFVGVPKDVAARVLLEFPTLTIRGVQVPVAIARAKEPVSQRPPPSRAPRPQRPDFDPDGGGGPPRRPYAGDRPRPYQDRGPRPGGKVAPFKKGGRGRGRS